MKKTITALGLIVCACSLHAASIDWKINATSSDVGAKVYILTSAAASYDSVAAFEQAAIASGTIEKVGSRSYYASGTVTDAAITKSLTALYAAVIDSDSASYKYLEIAVTSGMVYDLTASPPESPSSTFATTLSAINSSTTSGTISVPEPTSGLLLMLGIAGLALKRKHA